jgi:hypothetical protein
MLNSELQLTSDKVVGMERKGRNASVYLAGVITAKIAKKNRRGRKEERI